MRSLSVLVFLCILSAPSFSAGTPEWRESPEAAAILAEAGYDGTFVLYDPEAGILTGCSRERAETPFVPASTFKIANSLIGLSVGAVSSVDEILPYGGKPQPIREWERDMGIRDAVKVSNVPVYQELARRIGLERMREGVKRLGYGNGEIGDVVDRFWLDGPLRISAAEQCRFLARLARGELPLEAGAQEAVRDIVRLEERDGAVLYGKTGTAMCHAPALGWWVGWVEREGRVRAFALNIDMPDPGRDSGKRVELGRACLAAVGVW